MTDEEESGLPDKIYYGKKIYVRKRQEDICPQNGAAVLPDTPLQDEGVVGVTNNLNDIYPGSGKVIRLPIS